MKLTEVMYSATLEHVNLTVSDPARTAALLEEIFGWHIRWQGPSRFGGNTIHVGSETCYLALYAPAASLANQKGTEMTSGKLNHIALTVEDLEETENRIKKAGLKPFGHADYAPGRRFYFYDYDGIEYEIVSYT